MIWSISDLRKLIARGKWPWGAARGVTEATSPAAAEPRRPLPPRYSLAEMRAVTKAPLPVVEPPATALTPAAIEPRRPARRNRRKAVPMPRYSIAEMCAVLSALAEQQRQGVAAVNDVMAENHFAAHPTIVDGTNTMARAGDVLAAVAGLLGTLKREAAAGGDVRDLLRRM